MAIKLSCLSAFFLLIFSHLKPRFSFRYFFIIVDVMPEGVGGKGVIIPFYAGKVHMLPGSTLPERRFIYTGVLYPIPLVILMSDGEMAGNLDR
jgi:hypothetical protein